ncbi:MAG: (Fe-S)-binding protein [Alphaproteobacteria bacterium]|jgi:Fe-S oxidoreductase|nr:(Fe-S)-binding protein [Alphaproteobacteria bacterium]
MIPETPSLTAYLDETSASLAGACTACGKCVEVCPVTPTLALGGATGEAIMGDLRALFRDDTPLDGAARTWAHSCNGCGLCIPACPEAINPRRMVMLSGALESRHGSETPELFRKMSRSIRIMAALQLVPDDFDRLLRTPRAHDAEVIFYLGCNPIRTPHVLFNAMTILDALEVDYEVLGGPGACCGIIHAKWEGAFEKGGRVTDGTLDRFGDFRPEKVLSWCPSCVLHLGETIEGFRQTSFDFDHVTEFLAQQSERLTGRFKTSVEKRVLLHAHEGMAELGQNVARLLAAVPGLVLVDTVLEPGYTCGGSGADRSPSLKAAARARLLERAAADDVDCLVTLYHGCHGQLAKEEKPGNFEVVNWTEILVRALGGTPYYDISKHYRLADDWGLVLDEGEIFLRANGIEIDRAELEDVLPEIFAQSEFSGGLERFASPQR